MRAWIARVPLAVLLGIGVAVSQTRDEKPPATNLPPKLLSVTTSNPPAARKEAPLLLSDDKPLLLLDDEPGTNAPAGSGADNSRCQVCHLNFMQEAITVVHARTNIGCATCHGPSDAHIADESWASGGNGTPPDIIYRKSLSRFACLGCHNWVKLVESDQKKTDLKDKPDHLAVLDGTNREKRFCTDCHGQHRMVNRKCKWK
jgi:hypothetical protein